MPDLKITISGLKEALDKLSIPMARLTARAAKAAALETISVAKPEPAPSRAKQPFVSNKSRRYFFAALKSGAITVPYQRSHSLQDAWDWSPAGDGALVTNASPHADLTIVKGSRTKYHKKGPWKDEYQIAKDAEQAARDAAEVAVVSEITGLF